MTTTIGLSTIPSVALSTEHSAGPFTVRLLVYQQYVHNIVLSDHGNMFFPDKQRFPTNSVLTSAA